MKTPVAWLAVLPLAALALNSSVAQAFPVEGLGLGGVGRWDGGVATTLPAPALRPIRPINRWPSRFPWYRPVYPLVMPIGPAYYYPPTVWDSPWGWDGQYRDPSAYVQPPPQQSATQEPAKPKPPPRPVVKQWNPTTGRAEAVNVGRWEGSKWDGAEHNPDAASAANVPVEVNVLRPWTDNTRKTQKSK